MIRRPPRSTRKESSAASDVYKRQQQQTQVSIPVDCPKGYFNNIPLRTVSTVAGCDESSLGGPPQGRADLRPLATVPLGETPGLCASLHSSRYRDTGPGSSKRTTNDPLLEWHVETILEQEKSGNRNKLNTTSLTACCCATTLYINATGEGSQQTTPLTHYIIDQPLSLIHI